MGVCFLNSMNPVADLEDLEKISKRHMELQLIRNRNARILRPALDDHILFIQDAVRIASYIPAKNISALKEMGVNRISNSLEPSTRYHVGLAVRAYLSGQDFGSDALKQAVRLTIYVSEFARFVPPEYWKALKNKVFSETEPC